MGLVAAGAALLLVPLGILGSHYWIDTSEWLPQIPKIIKNGLLPLIVILSALGFFCGLVRKRFDASRVETIQALFALLLVAYVVLTLTGLWFRGEGMSLETPF